MHSCYSTTLRIVSRRTTASASVHPTSATVFPTEGRSPQGRAIASAAIRTGSYYLSSVGDHGSACFTFSRWMSSSTRQNKNKRTSKAIRGNRGTRGHGWYVKYREGRGGRHLQGEYWGHNEHHWDMQQWNEAVLSLGSQYVYLDIAVEPPSGGTFQSTANEAGASQKASSKEGEAFSKEVEASPKEVTSAVEPISTERLVIQVASTVMPETCINFIGLCEEAAYKGSVIYRIEKEVGLCGGDILTNTGKTGQCLQNWPYESTNKTPTIDMNPLRRDLPPPEEEPMALWHTAGTITMLCAKVNEIDSRFILCGNHAPHLDGIHRAFGKLEPESLKLVQEWQNSVLTSYGKPKSVNLKIVGCGVLENYRADDTKAPKEEKIFNEA